MTCASASNDRAMEGVAEPEKIVTLGLSGPGMPRAPVVREVICGKSDAGSVAIINNGHVDPAALIPLPPLPPPLGPRLRDPDYRISGLSEGPPGGSPGQPGVLRHPAPWRSTCRSKSIKSLWGLQATEGHTALIKERPNKESV